MPKDLKDVTICAADCVNPELAARALEKSTRQCDFGDAILFSDRILTGAFRTATINSLGSRAAYSSFVLRELCSHISTPFVLIVQWDGFVLSGAAWRSQFLDYDYIGAVWPWHIDGHNVGNGGFSLRTRKLLEATASFGHHSHDSLNEDELICRVYRTQLERSHHIKFAPEHLASAFSYERTVPNAPTFGFHGAFNLWRHLSDAELVDWIALCDPRFFQTREIVELLAQYTLLRKFESVRLIYRRIAAATTDTGVNTLIEQFIRDAHLAEFCIKVGESL